jgi:hypothetical protein
MKMLLIILMLIMMTSFVLADQTVKTIEVPFGYIAQTVADNFYNQTININPPDKIEQIYSVEFIAKGDFQASTDVAGKIRKVGGNWQDCSPNTWTTPNVDTSSYEISFDCSNLVSGFTEGNIEFGIQTNKIAQNIKGMIKMTYYNNPLGTINIFGTEYRAGERARVFLQLKDNQGLPENDGNCNLNVYYPNRVNSTADAFLTNAPMLLLEESDGIYFYDIAQLPEEYGVYMMTAGCNYQLSNAFVYYIDGTDSYFPNRTDTTGTYTGSTITLNFYNDYVYTKCVATGGATKTCQATYDFDTTIHFNNTENITDLNLYYMGEASNDALLTFEAWNWTSGTWYALPNNLTFSGISSANPIGLNDFVSNSIPDVNFISNVTGIIRIRLTGTSVVVYQQYDNWLNINLKTATGVVQDLKGSSEIHINDWFDYYRQSYTDSHWANFTGNISENILGQMTNHTWNYDGTISNNILNQIVNKIWNYTGTIVNNILTQFSDTIWTRTDRNLTYYPNMTCNPTLNATCELDYNLTAEDIWVYPTRNLTYYETGNITVNGTDIALAVWNFEGTAGDNVLNQIAKKVQCYLNSLLSQEDGEWSIDIPVC